ncbi:hypothetical protein V6N13_108093 [Hibiscus sabdariffa]
MKCVRINKRFRVEDTREAKVIRGVEDTGEAENTGRLEDTGGDVDIEDNFIVNIKVPSDFDEEVEEARDELRKTRQKIVLDDSEDEEQNDVESQGHAFVGNDTVVEEGLHEDNDKLEDNESDYLCSDSPGEYGEDKICGAYKGNKKYGHSNDPNCKFPLWELGLSFVDHIYFKEAVKKYAIVKGVVLRYLKSEPKRLRVCCKDGCPLLLFASFDGRAECLVVKTYNLVHTCFRTNKNKLLTCKHIQKVFKDRILIDPKMKIATLVTMVRQELRASTTYDMCKRAKKVVLRERRGSYVEEDGNNQMFSVVCAVVEEECKKSWNWFLTRLMEDLNHLEEEGLTLMSNQQEKLSMVGFWMQDAIQSSLCWMKSGKQVMQRMHVKKTWAANWPIGISPVAKQKLEKNIDHSSQCRLVWNGHGGFEVTQGEDQHIVDLERLTCTCRE